MTSVDNYCLYKIIVITFYARPGDSPITRKQISRKIPERIVISLEISTHDTTMKETLIFIAGFALLLESTEAMEPSKQTVTSHEDEKQVGCPVCGTAN